ncbi:MAG: EamA family transporter [Bacteroidia bacterium]|nr:EamA family transporter [Bacteroidia bacterium]
MLLRNAYVQMHIAILLWGLTGILGKAISISDGMTVWYRMLISALGLILLVLFRKNFRMPSKKSLIQLSALGALISIHWVFFFASITYSNVSVALSCFASISLFTAILEPLINKRKLQSFEILLGLCAILGIYIIFSFQKFYGLGILFALMSSLGGAIFTIYNKKQLEKEEPISITLIEMLTGFLFLTILLPFYFEVMGTSFQIPGKIDIILLLILGLLCTTFAFTISLYALKKLDAFTMNLSVNLEPIYSIILAFLIFNEGKELNIGFYIGTAIILASVFIHALFKKQNKSKIST